MFVLGKEEFANQPFPKWFDCQYWGDFCKRLKIPDFFFSSTCQLFLTFTAENNQEILGRLEGEEPNERPKQEALKKRREKKQTLKIETKNNNFIF